MYPHRKEFCFYLENERFLNKTTQYYYIKDVEKFFSHIKIKNVYEITEDHFVSFLIYLKVKKYSSSTCARTVSSLKMYFRFLKIQEHIEVDPTQNLDAPKIHHRIVDTLTIKEIKRCARMLNSKDRLIFEFLYATGLRVSELCQLDITDIENESIRIKGKGNKERIIPIAAVILERLNSYLKRNKIHEGAIFKNRNGNRITRQFVWNIIKKAIARAKITKKVSPHTLRHTYATHLLENGADIRIIQELLGHTNISNTEIYLHLTFKEMIEAFHKFHPRDKLKKRRH